MSGCGDTFAYDGLLAIANAIRDKACCGSSAGSCGPGSAGAGGTVETASAELDNGEGEYPEGFDSYAEYQTYKCDVATYIVNSLLTDVQSMQSINFAGLVVASAAPALAALLIDPIPGDEIVVIAGILITAAIGIAGGILGEMEDAINNNSDDLICSLYTASDVSAAETALEAQLASAIDGETADAVVRWEAKQVFNHMVTANMLNKLFTKDGTRTYPTGDCGNCNLPCQITMQLGSLTSVVNNGDGSYDVEFLAAQDPDTSNRWTVQFAIGAAFWYEEGSEVFDGWSGNVYGWWFRCDESYLQRGPLPVADETWGEENPWTGVKIWANTPGTQGSFTVTIHCADCP